MTVKNLYKGTSGKIATQAPGLRSLGARVCSLCFSAGLAIVLSSGTPGLLGGTTAVAQATPAARQIGTVKEVTPNKLVLTTDAGQTISVSVVEGAKILQLPPGSTDLKAAQVISLRDIENGDRVLVTGHQDATDAMTVSRVILMKSTDIAQKNAAEEADWQKRGTGGLVSAVDATSGTITVTSRGRSTKIVTQPSTLYRRYADGSVKFSDSVTGTLSQIQVGEQLRARGAKSEDGASITAEEIVSGAFENLSGTVVAVDTSAQTITLNDLATKQSHVIKVTANSSLRALPAEDAQRFAARARGAARPSAASSGGAGDKTKLPPAAGVAVGDSHSGPDHGSSSVGTDLSQLVNRLPQGSLADIHPGAMLMVVAEKSATGGDGLTATTVLSGVEPIVSATPKGSESMTLSPWNVGFGPDGGGA